jgi:DNA-binding XRE family transcriptional regulator
MVGDHYGWQTVKRPWLRNVTDTERNTDDEQEQEDTEDPGDPGAPVDRVNLGASIRSMRKRIGLTQEGLADRLGVHTTFVGRLERGERGAQWRTVRRVLRALELNPSDFAITLERIESEPELKPRGRAASRRAR